MREPQEAALPCRLCAAFPLTERGVFAILSSGFGDDDLWKEPP